MEEDKKERILEDFIFLYHELKPALEAELGQEIDCDPKEMSLDAFRWPGDPENQIEEILLLRAANSPPAFHQKDTSGDGSTESRILVNPYSKMWEGQKKIRYYCCHEMLHSVFNSITGCPPDKNNTREMNVISEGFCEYAAIDLFRGWFADEEEWMQRLEKSHLEDPISFGGTAEDGDVFLIGYSRHSLGYLHFMDALGPGAAKDAITLHVMKKAFEPIEEIRAELHTLVAKIFEKNILSKGLPEHPAFDSLRGSVDENNLKAEYVPSCDMGIYVPVRIYS